MPWKSVLPQKSDALIGIERKIVWFLGDAPEDPPTILNFLSPNYPGTGPGQLAELFESAVHDLCRRGLITVCRHGGKCGLERIGDERPAQLTAAVYYRSHDQRWGWKVLSPGIRHPIISLTDEGYRLCGF